MRSFHLSGSWFMRLGLTYTIMLTIGYSISHAATYSVFGSPSATGYLNTGTTVAGSFNITNLLTEPLDQYQISNATISFDFEGAKSATQYNGTQTFSGGQTGGGSSSIYRYYDRYENYVDPVDRIQLSAGSISGTSQSSTYYNSTIFEGTSTSPSGSHTYVWYTTQSCGWGCSRTVPNYRTITDYAVTDFYKRTQGLYGLFELDRSLGGSDIFDLVQDGNLDFSILVTSGTVKLNSAKLSFDAEWMDPSNVSAVPIPAAAWLFGSALIGVGLIGRRKTAT